MLPFYMTKIADPAKLKEIREKCKFMKKDRGRGPKHYDGREYSDPRYNPFDKPVTVTQATASLLFPSSTDPCERARQVRYWVSDKTDGIRYNLMLFRWSDPNSPLSIEEECSPRDGSADRSDQVGCAAVLVNEKFEAHSITVMCNPALFDGTLFDGEILHPNHMIANYNTSVAVLPVSVYLAYGVHRVAGRTANHLPFSENWEWRSKLLLPPEIYLDVFQDPVSQIQRYTWRDPDPSVKYEYARNSGFIVSREPDLILTTKNQFMILNELALKSRDEIYRFLQPGAYPTEPWGSAVLTPERQFMPGECVPLPTFKFKNRHTFDLEIVVPRDFPNSPPDVYCQSDSRRVRAVIKTPSLRVAPSNLNRRRGADDDVYTEEWPIYVDAYCYHLFSPGTRNIWECQLAKSAANRCYFAMPKMMRPDKAHPNAEFTINKTMETVEDCLGLDWLLDRAAEYYAYRPY